MKTHIKILLLSLVLIVFQGCLPTLYPLYHAKDLISIPDFEGSWIIDSRSDGMKWNVIQEDKDRPDYEYKNMYHIQMIENNDTLSYAGGIVKLGDFFYLDLYVVDFNFDGPLLSSHIFPVHTIWRISVNKNELEIRSFNSKWIRDLIENNQIRIPFENPDAGTLITAKTDELQAFVKKYGSDERSLDKTKKFVRG